MRNPLLARTRQSNLTDRNIQIFSKKAVLEATAVMNTLKNAGESDSHHSMLLFEHRTKMKLYYQFATDKVNRRFPRGGLLARGVAQAVKRSSYER